MDTAGSTPAHDFIAPRLAALVEEATAHGILRDVAVAVVTDLITRAPFNTSEPDPLADSEPHPTEPGPSAEARLFQQKDALLEQVVPPAQVI